MAPHALMAALEWMHISSALMCAKVNCTILVISTLLVELCLNQSLVAGTLSVLDCGDSLQVSECRTLILTLLACAIIGGSGIHKAARSQN